MTISWGMFSSEQLTELTQFLNEYSKQVGIEGDNPARDRVAARILRLFNDGVVKPEDLRRDLDVNPAHWQIDQAGATP